MDQSSETLREFIELYKNETEVLLSGSVAELPLIYVISNPTDCDVMRVPVRLSAVDRGTPLKSQRGGRQEGPLKSQGGGRQERFIIHSSSCHPGFVKLWSDRKQSYVKRDLFGDFGVRWDEAIYGPSIRRNIFQTNDLSRILSQLLNLSPEFGTLTVDTVFAIKCPVWPLAAREWVSRQREHGWPNQELVDRIVNGGCHLVAKSHGSIPMDDEEGRFSFSRAEIVLVHSWTAKQKYVYHVLRLVKGDLLAKYKRDCKEVGSILSSYYFKTLMFWKCEELPVDLWNKTNLEIIKTLLLCFVEWLIGKRCPNYFIKSCNMFDNLEQSSSLTYAIESILSATDDDDVICGYFTKSPMTFGDPFTPDQLNSKTKDFIFNGCALFAKHNLILPLSNEVLSLDKYANISSEYLNLIRGIARNRELNKSMPNAALLLDEVANCFTCPRGRTKNSESLHLPTSMFFVSLTESLENIIGHHLRDTTTVLPSNGERHPVDLRRAWNTHRRDSEPPYLNMCKNLFQIFLQSVANQGKPDSTHPRILKYEMMLNGAIQFCFSNRPDAFHFLQSAHHANMLFTRESDYARTLEFCDGVIQYSRSLETKPWNAHREIVFPLVLNSGWSELYDPQIQLVLGFLTLARRVTPKSKMILPKTIKVCPVMFVQYIRLKCFRKLGIPKDVCLAHHTNHCHLFHVFSTMCILLAHLLEVRWSSTENTKRILGTRLECSLQENEKIHEDV